MPAESTTPIASAESPPWLRSALYGWRRLLGWCLRAMPLHRWPTPLALPAGWGRKARTGWCEAILPLGNLYLSLHRAHSEVLPSRLWLDREVAVASALNRDVCSHPRLRALDMRLLPGISLRQMLTADLPRETQLDALRLAAAALRRLHAVNQTSGSGNAQRMSHGDATCHNVVVDLAAKTAHWIDFDTRHREHLSQKARHAEDLRTLLFSGAVFLPESLHQAGVAAVVDGYGDVETVERVRHELRRRFLPNVFQLAQSPLPFQQFENLRRMLLQAE